MAILVTGGTGLVGSHVLLDLCSKEHDRIIASYRNIEKIKTVESLFKREGKKELLSKINWIELDINNLIDLEEIFKEVDFVYHIAAIVSFNEKDYSKLMETNTTATANIVNLCIQNDVKKLCYTSSVSALGDYPEGKCIDEDAPWQKTKTTSAYSISKFYAENEVWRGSEEGLDIVIVNPVTILGFGDWDESSLKIIKRVASGLSFYPNGSNGFIGANDVAKTMTFLMNSDIKNKRFVLVSENLKFKTIFSLIAKKLGVSPPKKLLPRKFASIFMQLEKIRSVFGGTPLVNSSTLHTAYQEKCYSSKRIRDVLPFTFKPISEVIQDSLD